jgi:hypothetical protein
LSPFEALMIICFGAAWPLSIFKSIHSRSTRGKSVLFLYVVFIGYVSGCIHKFKYNMDPIIWLYVLNATMVAIDAAMFHRNRRLERALLAKAAVEENPPY